MMTETTLQKRLCSVDTCSKFAKSKGFCSLHYGRWRRLGDAYASVAKKRTTSASYIEDGIGYIELAGSRGFAMVDAEDFERINKRLWQLSSKGYATCIISVGKNRQIVFMHHDVVGKPAQGLCTDHINQDRSDNRKDNLRNVTHSENLFNTGMRSTNTSGFKGVSFDKINQRWVAYISYEKKSRNLGSFKIKDQAIFCSRIGRLLWSSFQSYKSCYL